MVKYIVDNAQNFAGANLLFSNMTNEAKDEILIAIFNQDIYIEDKANGIGLTEDANIIKLDGLIETEICSENKYDLMSKFVKEINNKRRECICNPSRVQEVIKSIKTNWNNSQISNFQIYCFLKQLL